MTESVRAISLTGRCHDGVSPGQRLARESELLSVEEPDTAAGLERIESGRVDCVLVDAARTASDDADVVARVRDVDSRIPVIGITDGGARASTDAIADGLTDVVALPSDGAPARHLARRVENAAIRYRCGPETGDGTGLGTEPAEQRPDGSVATAMPDHEEYERLFGAIDQSIFVTDADGVYTYVNPEGAKITGYDPEEIVGERPDLLHPDETEKQKVLDAVDRLLADEETSVVTVDAALETKDGAVVPMEAAITPRNGASGEFTGVVGVVRDVSEERETEQRFRELQAILQAMPDEVTIHDTEGYIERVIPAVGKEATASGYSLEEVQGMHLGELMDDEALEYAVEMITEIITGERERATQELQIHTKDGGRIWRESHFTTLEDNEGNIEGSVGVLRDIEERKAYELELERQNERLEEFASIASHDLRNPLNLAQGYMEMVEDECDTEYTAQVTDALDRMGKLIDDTLTWARQGATVSERQPISIEALAPDCWDAVGTDAGTLEVVEDVTVDGDPSRVRRVLENLLRNAVEHGSEDVTVRIGATDGEGDPDGRSVGFYVADDGPGIPPDQREAVFEAGMTNAADGTGFGLAIIAEIVDAHGWDVRVTEGESGGARFEITGIAEHT